MLSFFVIFLISTLSLVTCQDYCNYVNFQDKQYATDVCFLLENIGWTIFKCDGGQVKFHTYNETLCEGSYTNYDTQLTEFNCNLSPCSFQYSSRCKDDDYTLTAKVIDHCVKVDSAVSSLKYECCQDGKTIRQTQYNTNNCTVNEPSDLIVQFYINSTCTRQQYINYQSKTPVAVQALDVNCEGVDTVYCDGIFTSDPTANPTASPILSGITSNPTTSPSMGPTRIPTDGPTPYPTMLGINDTYSPTLSPITSSPTFPTTEQPTSSPISTTESPTAEPTFSVLSTQTPNNSTTKPKRGGGSSGDNSTTIIIAVVVGVVLFICMGIGYYYYKTKKLKRGATVDWNAYEPLNAEVTEA